MPRSTLVAAGYVASAVLLVLAVAFGAIAVKEHTKKERWKTNDTTTGRQIQSTSPYPGECPPDPICGVRRRRPLQRHTTEWTIAAAGSGVAGLLVLGGTIGLSRRRRHRGRQPDDPS